MPYFHVYMVVKENGKKRHFLPPNLSQKKLKEVVEAYEEDKRFMLSGRVYYPSRINKITVFESDKKFRDLILPNGKSPVGRGASVVAKYFARKKVEGVRTVTGQFFKSPPREKSIESAKKPIDKKNVFIVHGRDHEPMKELKALLIDLDFNPIVLHEQAGGGSPTLVEKLEKYAGNVGYTFVILTPEDIGGNKDEMRKKLRADKPLFQRTVAIVGTNPCDEVLKEFEPRARQNVIFEMGYFFALLGRKNVCCLLKGTMVKPSDIDGVEYGHFNTSINEVKGKIVKELKAVGYEITT